MNDLSSTQDTAARPDTAAGAEAPALPAGAAAATRWLRRAGSQRPDPGVRDSWAALLVATAREAEALAREPATLFPHYTVDGRWRLLDIGAVSGMADGHYEHGNWTAGFSLGVLWLDALGRAAGPGDAASPMIREARRRLAPLAPRAADHTTHDLGFLFYPSVALGHDLGWVDLASAQPALQAARQIYLRYNPRTQLIQAFGPARQPGLAGTSTIDTMMNLPLLFWAARHGADHVLADAALRHARTSARLYFRPDGSTYHLLTLDPVSGELLGRGTFQGAGDGSCWSRGQAWAVAGFAWAYGVSRERELLEAADRAAAYFFGHLPADAVAPWDFTAAGDGIRDASASAAVALGCLFLTESHPESAAAEAYRAAGNAILGALARDCLNTGPTTDGLLLHSCYSKPHNLGTDSATAWGDFYFTLAMALAAGKIPISTLFNGDRTHGD
jgi:unsaturated chondroitin disaccharide hydrolase